MIIIQNYYIIKNIKKQDPKGEKNAFQKRSANKNGKIAHNNSKGCDKMESVWKKTAEKPSFPTFAGVSKTDVVIIGGGLAGILCAYRLKKLGVDCLLLEADQIGSGITKNTTAKITLQHGLLYDKLIRKFGVEKAYLYLSAQRKALLEYEKLCQEIHCDYEKKDSFVYSIDNRAKIEKELLAFHHLGEKAEFSSAPALPFSVSGAVKVEDQAQFHPLKFAFSLAKDLPLYENTRAVQIKPRSVVTERGEIFCEKIIVATHFPILNRYGAYFLKLYQHRSYVLALSGGPQLSGMYVDEKNTGLSFRNYKDLLFVGGGDHRTGKNGGNYRELERVAEKYYPNSVFRYRWATQDCMSLDEVPYIGQYSPFTPNLFVATGFNKWGMTNSMVASLILSDLVRGKRNDFAPVFSPSRSILRPQLAVNSFESALGLLTPTAPRCPHLGCALQYNRAEHSWDCPCHGSRFTKEGNLIDNPSIYDVKID